MIHAKVGYKSKICDFWFITVICYITHLNKCHKTGIYAAMAYDAKDTRRFGFLRRSPSHLTGEIVLLRITALANSI